VKRTIDSSYRDPLELIWLHAVREVGYEVERSHGVYASFDGQRTLSITHAEHFDPDTGGRLSGFRRGRDELRIARAHGPRRLVGGWWRDPWARDEYELLTTDGALYRVGRDLHARRWLLLAEED
jgi:hypothetical protein